MSAPCQRVRTVDIDEFGQCVQIVSNADSSMILRCGSCSNFVHIRPIPNRDHTVISCSVCSWQRIAPQELIEKNNCDGLASHLMYRPS